MLQLSPDQRALMQVLLELLSLDCNDSLEASDLPLAFLNGGLSKTDALGNLIEAVLGFIQQSFIFELEGATLKELDVHLLPGRLELLIQEGHGLVEDSARVQIPKASVRPLFQKVSVVNGNGRVLLLRSDWLLTEGPLSMLLCKQRFDLWCDLLHVL